MYIFVCTSVCVYDGVHTFYQRCHVSIILCIYNIYNVYVRVPNAYIDFLRPERMKTNIVHLYDNNIIPYICA